MKKIIFLCTVILPAFVHLEARTYTIGMIHWIAYSPLNVASVNGFWKKQGIDVEVINYSSNQSLNKSLEFKKIDIALDMIGSWVGMFLTGSPLMVIGETDWSHGGDKIIAKKNMDLKALKGQTIGVYLNLPSVTFFLNKYLSANGIKMSELKIVEQEPEALANFFIGDRFKIIVNYDPQALFAERNGNGVVVATSADYHGVIPEGFVSRTDVFSGIPEVDLIKIFKGWTEAVQWCGDPANWAEYKKILNEKTFEGEKPYPESDLKAMLASVKIHSKKEQLQQNKTGGGLYAYFKDLNDFLRQNNLSTKTFTPEDIFNNKAIVKALE